VGRWEWFGAMRGRRKPAPCCIRDAPCRQGRRRSRTRPHLPLRVKHGHRSSGRLAYRTSDSEGSYVDSCLAPSPRGAHQAPSGAILWWIRARQSARCRQDRARPSVVFLFVLRQPASPARRVHDAGAAGRRCLGGGLTRLGMGILRSLLLKESRR